MNARALIQKHEGCTLHAIRDTRGYSIGWGHDGASEGDTCTQEEANDFFDKDFATAQQAAKAVIGADTWINLVEPRQAVLTDMAYEMGARGLSMFKVSLSLIRLADYEAASAEMLNSDWAKQVPSRANENAKIMETGQYPA